MTEEQAKNLIVDELKSLDAGIMVDIFNGYQDEMNGERLYFMDDFDEVMSASSPWEVTRSAFFGDFNPTHDYFTFNGYGNLESVHRWDIESYLDCYYDDIAQWAIDNNCDWGLDEVRAILDAIEH